MMVINANKLLYTETIDEYVDLQQTVEHYEKDILDYLEENGFTVVNLFRIIAQLRQTAMNDGVGKWPTR